MRTEFLTDWEIAALQHLTQLAGDLPNDYHGPSMQVLREKIELCSHIRLTFRTVPDVLRVKIDCIDVSKQPVD